MPPRTFNASANTRRPTRPIPAELRARFYSVAWQIAEHGRYQLPDGKWRDAGRPHTVRRHAIAVLWMTACALRFSELRRLRVADVSEAGYSAFITRSKGGIGGHHEVASLLITLTFQWRNTATAVFESAWLIPSQTGSQLNVNAFNRDACGMFRYLFPGLPLTSHCFRDTAAQMALVQGAGVRVVQRLLGHASAGTTEIYIRKQDAEAFQLRLFEAECSESPVQEYVG